MKKHYFTYLFIFIFCVFGYAQDIPFPTIPPNDDCGTVLNFDGTNDYVQLENSLTTGSTSSTVEVWVKVPEVNTQGLISTDRVGNIISNFNSSPNTNYEIHNRGDIRFFWNGGQIDQRGTTDLRDNQWHHIAFVRDISSNEVITYIDGEEEFTVNTAGTNINFSTPHRIGGDNRDVNGGPSFHGAIDELRIWNVALTRAEIFELASQQLVGNETDLVNYFNFNNGENSTILTDLTDNSNGTLVQMDPATDWTKLDGLEDPRTVSSITESACESFEFNGQIFTESGLFEVIIDNAAGCDSTITLDLTIDETPDNTITRGVTSFTSNAVGPNVTYQWIDCDDDNTPLVDETDAEFIATGNGSFGVIVTNGTCVDTSDCDFFIVTGVDESLTSSSISVFPNPTTDFVSIDLGAINQGIKISIVDIYGKIIKEKNISGISTTSLSLEEAVPGVYFIRVEIDGNLLHTTITKE